MFPGVPEKFTEEVKNDKSHRFEVTLPKKWFAVSYYDSSNSSILNEKELKARYDFIRDGMVKLPDVKQVGEREIQLGENLGREIIYSIKGHLVTSRIYLIRHRLFQATTTISPPLIDDTITKSESDKFLDSFRYTEELGQ